MKIRDGKDTQIKQENKKERKRGVQGQEEKYSEEGGDGKEKKKKK